jgi:hypothetical protein
MRVIVAGSRDITDYGFVCKAIEESCFDVTEVVCGGARGVDYLGEQWAKANGVPVIYFMAEWDKNGKSAGYIRNNEMGEYCDGLIAVWDGKSRGTRHMIDIAQRLGREVFVRKPNKWEREWK